MTTTPAAARRQPVARLLVLIPFLLVLFSSCKKDDKDPSSSPAAHSSEVLDKWMTLQLRLMRNATGIPNQGFARHYAYAGVAALEALRPGIPSGVLWARKWNGLTGLPAAGKSKSYYYPANVNAA
ncbi:MAG TPA: hypothetical protein VHK69_19675, partial [Chitinophagaceae bacterium]|nr:hypothetical protein [Chitinophagaceae bacterium]